MFNYDVLCMICGRNKVYEAAFKEALSDDYIKTTNTRAVCKDCGSRFLEARKTGISLPITNRPKFRLKEDV